MMNFGIGFELINPTGSQTDPLGRNHQLSSDEDEKQTGKIPWKLDSQAGHTVIRQTYTNSRRSRNELFAPVATQTTGK